jgi:CheY-like chemotaxis protein
MEILLVEDSLAAARLTIGALRQSELQHRLTWLRDGAEAFEYLQQSGKFARAPQPDLILLDLLLPGVDGPELLRRMRASAALQRTPVVVMTGAAESRTDLGPGALQVDAYLVKPINVSEFLTVVHQLKDVWRDKMVLLGPPHSTPGD